MALQVENREICKVPVLDDDPAYRATLQDSVAELGVEVIDAPGPYRELGACVDFLRASGDAVVCDHRLTPAGYAAFDGAELSAALFLAGVPSVLCTRYEKQDIDDIRRYRANIPVLLRPDELISRLEAAIRVCIREMEGKYLAERRKWRTLVRIVESDLQFVTLMIPAWSPTRPIHVPKTDLPEWLVARAKPKFRCHAMVNIGAEREEDLFLQGWRE